MIKRVFAVLLCVLMLGALACTQPAPRGAEAPVPTETETEPAPEEPAALQATEEPAAPAPIAEAEEEYTLEPEPGCNQLTIYWTAESINFDTSDVWLWFPGADGRGYRFYPCAYGAKCVVNVPEDVIEVGFIVRRDCSDPFGTSWGSSATKDFEDDRFVPMEGPDTKIYLKTGDGAIYYSEDGGVNLYQKLTFDFAGIVATNQIKYRINPAAKLTDLSMVKVYCEGTPVTVESVSSLNNEVVTGNITVAEPIDITKSYDVEIQGYGKQTAVPTGIFDTQEFIDTYTYDGDDLGAVIGADGTTFKVWAPTASSVILNLFEAGDGGEAYSNLEMTRGEHGVWSAAVDCGHGTYYTYTVTTAVGTKEAVDPYAKTVGVNGNRGMVVDLDSTDPAGFENDSFIGGLNSYRDAVVWEVHVRDFSNRIASSQYPGKYLAFTETGLKNESGIPVGVDYLKELGITHVHFQPIYDYATVDETHPEDQFNWGYDPKNYNAPEGSYSTDPYHGEVRVNELKQMVQSLHKNGLAVVMDVVYNHTYDKDANLNRVVPYYYYRYTVSGENSNGSGCGNETASERYMFRKYMIDSLRYWQSEYHIDGFRFDLMALHDLDTMQAIEEALHAVNPQALIYGEGWTGGTTTLRSNRQTSRENIAEIHATGNAIGGIAVFNDAIRDGLKGSVFDQKAQGYINGMVTKANANAVLFGTTGGAWTKGASWKVNDAMIINYMSSHDNRTLWDILKNALPDGSEDDLCAANRLGASLVLLSKGTPFMLAGEEMLRTKQNDGNSYASSDEINNLDWEALTPHSNAYEMSKFYASLIQLRKANPWVYNSEVTGEVLDQNAITMLYTDGETVKGFAAANPTSGDLVIQLPEGTWNGLWNVSGTVEGTVTVPPMSVVLLGAK